MKNSKFRNVHGRTFLNDAIRSFGLSFKDFFIDGARLQQFIMRTERRDGAAIEHEDFIRMLHGRNPLRNNNLRRFGEKFLK